MAKVSDKSTKAQILEEVARLEAQLKETRTANTTVAQVQEEKTIAVKKESAKEIIAKNILAPDIIEGYNDVMAAIVLAKKELAEIQEVKEAIIDAEAVIMAKDALIEQRDAALQERIVKVQAEADDIISKREANVLDLEAYYLDLKTALEKERKREAEEFAYKLKRDRQIQNDQWEDVKATREKALEQKEVDLSERTSDIEARELEVKTLQDRVAEIPDLVSEAKDTAFAEAKKSFDREKAIETAGIKKNAEWEIKVANMEKERAVEDLGKANDRISSLEAKLESAYASMNTLATTTVQSTGGVKILETGKDK